jgi:hypothetical protein
MQDKFGLLWTAVLANVVGGLVFFVPDMCIFKEQSNWIVIDKETRKILQRFNNARLARAFVDEYRDYFSTRGINVIYTKEE